MAKLPKNKEYKLPKLGKLVAPRPLKPLPNQMALFETGPRKRKK